MNDTIIVALISLIGTLGGTFSGILVGSKLLTYRVDQLEKKVEKHNNVIERTYKLEQDAALYEQQINFVEDRIKDLERRIEVS